MKRGGDPQHILAVTGGRADWGLLLPVLRALEEAPDITLTLAVTGQHMAEDGQGSLQAVRAEAFTQVAEIDMGLGDDDSPPALSAATGRALGGIGQVIEAVRPDLMLVLGDRYEILAACLAATLARVPIAHLCGGDITAGAMDDAIRHAITKLAALHFPSTEAAGRRLCQMGEDPARVHVVGSPGLDLVAAVPRLDRATLWGELGLAPADQAFLVTLHSETLGQGTAALTGALTQALDAYPEAAVIVTGSNADPGGRAIDIALRAWVDTRANAVFRVTLGARRYFSALGVVDAVVGNSSSGLYEAPSFAVPTVNIGTRQDGRARAASVIDCAATPEAVTEALAQALVMDPRGVKNPYGDGRAAPRILEVLRAAPDRTRLLRKVFCEEKNP